MPKKLVTFELSSYYSRVCFTLNNWSQDEYNQLWIWCRKFAPYFVIGKEVGESGTPHLQGYIEWATKKRGQTLHKFNTRIHWEPALGTPTQASDYCKKEGQWAEWGDRKEDPKRGSRTDLIEVVEELQSGISLDSVTIQRPQIYHQYGRTLTKIEDLVMRKKFRTEMTTCDWYFGKTGVGKSHIAFTNYSPETHYVWKDDKGWWDKYTQQDVVILNDFRGEIRYNHLLQLIDKYPYDVSRRGKEPMPFISKHVIITSSLRPQDAYPNRENEDSIQQLLRRIKVHEVGYCKCELCKDCLIRSVP